MRRSGVRQNDVPFFSCRVSSCADREDHGLDLRGCLRGDIPWTEEVFVGQGFLLKVLVLLVEGSAFSFDLFDDPGDASDIFLVMGLDLFLFAGGDD